MNSFGDPLSVALCRLYRFEKARILWVLWLLIVLSPLGHAAQVIATGLTNAQGALAAEDGILYFVEDNQIKKMPTLGGAATLLGGPGGFNILGNDLVGGYGSYNGAYVFRQPKAGGARTILAGPFSGGGYVAARGGFAYYLEGFGQLFRVPVAGGPSQIVAGTGWIRSSAFDDQRLYYYEYSTKNVKWAGFEGGLGDLITGNSAEGQLFIDATHVYTSEGGKIRKVPKAGGTVVTIADEPGLAGYASDGIHVYYTHAGNLKRISVNGGIGEILETVGSAFGSFIMDSDAYYWMDYTVGPQGQRILRLPRVPSLRTWLKFEGNFMDSTGYGNSATPSGNTQFGVGVSGQGLYLDGSPATFVNAVPDTFLPRVTAACWVRPADTADASLVDAWKDRENYRLFMRGGRFVAAFHKNGAGEIEAIASTPYVQGLLYHAAMTFDGTMLHLYINGQLAQSAAQPDGSDSSPGVNPDLRIGISRDGSQRFNGMLDDVRVYDTALAPTDIAALSSVGSTSGAITGLVTGALIPGTVLVRASFGPNSYTAPVDAAGQFLIPGVPSGISYSVFAFRDTNGNQSPDYDEWYGLFVSPLLVTGFHSGIDITLLAPDADGDGLYDPWERLNGFNVGLADGDNDSDGDGLSNAQEFRLQTAAHNADTDGDGAGDGDELMIYGSDPADGDSDTDGMPDGWEITNGLNPLLHDASFDHDLDGLTNKEEYDQRLLGYRANAVNSRAGTPTDDHQSDYRRLKGEGWVRRTYDKNDRLVATERDTGLSQVYIYDANGRKARDVVLPARDGDTDGLPDAWEFANGLAFAGTTAAVGPNGPAGDADGDGFTNQQEWAAETDPNSEFSFPSTGRSNAGSPLVSPLTQSRWLMATGQLESSGGASIVVGADGSPGTQTSVLKVMHRSGGGWNQETISLGMNAASSLTIGNPSIWSYGTIYAGIHGSGVAEIAAWQRTSFTWSKTTSPLTAANGATVDVVGLASDTRLVSIGTPTGTTSSGIQHQGLLSGAWQIHQRTALAVPSFGHPQIYSGNDAAGSTGIVNWQGNNQVRRGTSALGLSGMMLYPVNQKWYFLTPNSVSWQQAEDFAVSAGGHLVTITDAAQNKWLQNSFLFEYAWIGLRNLGSNGAWGWVSGSGETFRNWLPGISPNGWPTETLGYIYGSTGYWDDARSDLLFRGLVEVAAPVFSETTMTLPVQAALHWAGKSFAYGKFRGAAAEGSLAIACVDDSDASSGLNAADTFRVMEFSALQSTPAFKTNRTLTVNSSGPLAYGLATIHRSGGKADALAVGEQDGTVSLWTAPNATDPLVRKVLTTQFVGQAWHQMEPLKEADGREGLVGLLVNPATPNQCQVIHWTPDALDAALSGTAPVLNNAPLARVMPTPSSGGGTSTVGIRLWDAEAHASRVVLQFQRPGQTNWQAMTLLNAGAGGASGTTAPLSTQPGGVTHSLTWNALADLGATFNGTVLLRTQATDSQSLVGQWSEPMPYSVNTAADLDSDGDGATDAAELAFGTNPNAANSRPVLQVTRNANGTFTFTWPVAAGGTYRIQSSQDLKTWTTLQSGLTNGTWIMPVPPNFAVEKAKFYRVMAE